MEQILKVLMMLALVAASAPGQKNKSGVRPMAMAAQTASFGMLTPSRSGMPVSVTMLYSLAIPAAFASTAYQVNATGSCTFTPAAPAAGGKTISDSDIGIGIIAISPSAGIAIASVLNYDPGAVKANNGQPGYAGMAGGQATIADLHSGHDIIRGNQAPSGNQLSITVRVATVPQFVTPGSLSCQIVLTVM
jgi:hypothetical protein